MCHDCLREPLSMRACPAHPPALNSTAAGLHAWVGCPKTGPTTGEGDWSDRCGRRRVPRPELPRHGPAGAPPRAGGPAAHGASRAEESIGGSGDAGPRGPRCLGDGRVRSAGAERRSCGQRVRSLPWSGHLPERRGRQRRAHPQDREPEWRRHDGRRHARQRHDEWQHDEQGLCELPRPRWPRPTTSQFTAPDITYANLTDPKGMLMPDGTRGPVYTDAGIEKAVTQASTRPAATYNGRCRGGS